MSKWEVMRNRQMDMLIARLQEEREKLSQIQNVLDEQRFIADRLLNNNEKLEEELSQIQNVLDDQRVINDRLLNDNEKLEEENERLQKACDWYSKTLQNLLLERNLQTSLPSATIPQ